MYNIRKDISKEIVEEFANLISNRDNILSIGLATADIIIRAFVDVSNKIAYRQNLLDQDLDPDDLDKEINTVRDEINTLLIQHKNNLKNLQEIEKTIEIFQEENNLPIKENPTVH